MTPYPYLHAATNLLDWVRTHQATGHRLDESARFLPLLALTQRFNVRHAVADLVKEVTDKPIDVGTIRRYFAKVFVTLLKINRHGYIEHFIKHHLSDERLPLLSEPPELEALSTDATFFDEFYREQWQFCAPVFEYEELQDRCYDKNTILPILTRTKLGEGGNSHIYAITLHPDHDRLARSQKASSLAAERRYVLKTFRTRNAEQYYNAEREAHLRLRERGPHDNLIAYFGSFRHGDTYNIVLEYADQGDLESYLGLNSPPTRSADMLTFYKRIFELVQGIFHMQELLEGGRYGGFGLRGFHQDLNPYNILVLSEGKDNPYDFRFKIADFGTAQFKRGTAAESTIGIDARGSLAYAPPECHRAYVPMDKSPISITPAVDVWSIGCILLECMVWLVYSYQDLASFRKARTEEAVQAGLDDGECFHKRDKILDSVEQMFISLRTGCRGDDFVTPRAIDVLQEMIVVDHVARLTSGQVIRKLKTVLQEAENQLLHAYSGPNTPRSPNYPLAGSHTPFWPQRECTLNQHHASPGPISAGSPVRAYSTHHRSRDSYSRPPTAYQSPENASRGLGIRASTNGHTDADFQEPSRAGAIEMSDPSPKLSKGKGKQSSAEIQLEPDFSPYGRFMPRNSSYEHATASGPSSDPSRRSNEPPSFSNTSLQGTKQAWINNAYPSYQENPVEHCDHGSTRQLTALNGTRRSVRWHNGTREIDVSQEPVYDERYEPSRSSSFRNSPGNHHQVLDSNLGARVGVAPEDDLYLNQPGLSVNQLPENSLPIRPLDTTGRNIPPTNPSYHRVYPGGDLQEALGASRTEVLGNLPAFSRPSHPIQHLPRPNVQPRDKKPVPRCTVEEARKYIRGKKQKDKNATLPYHNYLDDLDKRDYEFILDNSFSMDEHWPQVTELLAVLGYLLKPSDPDGLELYPTIPHKGFNEPVREKKSSNLVKHAERMLRRESSDITLKLGERLTDYEQRIRRRSQALSIRNLAANSRLRPKTIFIFTDGQWATKSDPANSILRVAKLLQDTGLGYKQLGIQFILFGKSPIAIKELRRLDTLGKHSENERDIVDFTSREENNIWKMIYGSIDRIFDDDD